MDKIKEAKRKIKDRLSEDDGFKADHVCKITTLLYTNFPDVKISFRKKKDYVNDMADKLLDLILE